KAPSLTTRNPRERYCAHSAGRDRDGPTRLELLIRGTQASGSPRSGNLQLSADAATPRATRRSLNNAARRERRPGARDARRTRSRYRGCIGDEDNSGVPAKTWSVLCGAFSWGGPADRVPGRRAAEHALFSDRLAAGQPRPAVSPGRTGSTEAAGRSPAAAAAGAGSAGRTAAGWVPGA